MVTQVTILMVLYLLFPVEATSVTVGYIDITIRLEDCQLKTPQDTVEELATGCLKTATHSVTPNITKSKDRRPVFRQWQAPISPQVIVSADIPFDQNTCRCESRRISDAALQPEAEDMYIYIYQMSHIV